MPIFLDLVDAAVTAAAAGVRLLATVTPPSPAGWTEKARRDFVTDVDREVEQHVATLLQSAVPDSVVLGEELTPAAARDAHVVWIVDPLDGTTNFLHRYPQYAVSIGAVVDGALAVGVVHDVARDLVYRAAVGHGAWLGNARLAVSGLADPTRALVGTGFPFKDMGQVEPYLRQLGAVLRGTSGARRTGSAALDLADVAAGRLDAFWELLLAPWDVAAGVVLIREAGGVVTTLGGDTDVLQGGSIVAGNPVLHRWLGELLSQA